LNAARQASEPGATLCSFVDWRQLPILTDAIQAGGWTWRNIATWWKPGIRMQRGRFSSSAEYVVYASNGPITEGKSSPQNVFSCAVESDKEHIAQKPELVMSWILSVIAEGSTVLDPFMGSGSTLASAKKLGYKAIGIDVDERYCEIAVRRLSQEVLAL
jgi:site-specific DNA-methyltransferase (adenine-specific)